MLNGQRLFFVGSFVPSGLFCDVDLVVPIFFSIESRVDFTPSI
jgi:hypothetical protein